MKEIKLNGKTVAIFHRLADWKEGLDFLTANEAFIQVGSWWYHGGKELKPHIHIRNERLIERTQEIIVVLSGRVRVDLYNEKKGIFYQEELGTGDIGVTLTVGHGYQIMEDDTKVVEIKNGPFVSVEKDKEILF